MIKLEKDTIFALASARGAAGVSVVRVSGKKAFESLKSLSNIKQIRPRMAELAMLKSLDKQTIIDQAITIAFVGPNSFTGEDVVEYHCHGSVAVLEALFAELLQLGLRGAEPGEFTRRAFSNNRLDLMQAEGLADLINAQTEAQRQQALQQMNGDLSNEVSVWRSLLLSTLARVEAEIDFAEEEDVTGNLAEQVLPDLDALITLLQLQIDLSSRGLKVRDGFVIALIGQVNSGKSTLLNALAGEDRAIVSDIPGTTRDIIEVQLQIGGFMVSIADTAGLRDANDAVEQEGIRRTQKLAKSADLRVFLLDGSVAQCAENKTTIFSKKPDDLIIYTKADLGVFVEKKPDELIISAKSGQGIEDLLQTLKRKVVEVLSVAETPSLTRARHVKTVGEALTLLITAKKALNKPEGYQAELVAEDLRVAGQHLGLLLGAVHSEQVLDEIFSGFCIGK